VSEPAGTAPVEQPLNNYRITLLNGQRFDMGSPAAWGTFWSLIARDGWCVAPLGFIPYHAIASIEPIPAPATGQVVRLVQAGGQPANL